MDSCTQKKIMEITEWWLGTPFLEKYRKIGEAYLKKLEAGIKKEPAGRR